MEVQSSVLTPVSLVDTARALGNGKTTWAEHAKPFPSTQCELALNLTRGDSERSQY